MIFSKKQSKDGNDKLITFIKNPNEVNQFQLMKELKKNLEEKAFKAIQFISKNEVLNHTLGTLYEKYIMPKSGEVVPLDFYQRSLKLCFYGLANRVKYNF